MLASLHQRCLGLCATSGSLNWGRTGGQASWGGLATPLVLPDLVSSLQALFLFGVAVQLAGQKLLRSMARPSLGGAGQLLDCGTDLSSSFIAE